METALSMADEVMPNAVASLPTKPVWIELLTLGVKLVVSDVLTTLIVVCVSTMLVKLDALPPTLNDVVFRTLVEDIELNAVAVEEFDLNMDEVVRLTELKDQPSLAVALLMGSDAATAVATVEENRSDCSKVPVAFFVLDAVKLGLRPVVLAVRTDEDEEIDVNTCGPTVQLGGTNDDVPVPLSLPIPIVCDESAGLVLLDRVLPELLSVTDAFVGSPPDLGWLV